MYIRNNLNSILNEAIYLTKKISVTVILILNVHMSDWCYESYLILFILYFCFTFSSLRTTTVPKQSLILFPIYNRNQILWFEYGFIFIIKIFRLFINIEIRQLNIAII